MVEVSTRFRGFLKVVMRGSMHLPQIDIVMPTYNCALWVDAFMESLVSQNMRDWRLIVRDDGSSDGTPSLLDVWARRLGSRMEIIPGDRNLGTIGSFTHLLAASTAPWVMTADPDDIWLPGKIALTTQAMLDAEARHGAEAPIVVSTDAIVVDNELEVLSRSWWKWSRMSAKEPFGAVRTAVESPALGSTMILNRALIERALPIPSEAKWQDWWLALVAAALGKLVVLPSATILYRRHGQNLTGNMESPSWTEALRRLVSAPALMRGRLRKELSLTGGRTSVFFERYGDRLCPRDIAAISALMELPGKSAIRDRISIIQHGLWFSTLSRNARLMLLL